jgi:conjugative transfer signal peptidase TraF
MGKQLRGRPRLRNPARESRAERRSRNLMIGTNKKRHRTVEVADPDLGRAGVEIESAFFVDLGRSIRSGKDLDAHRRSNGKRRRCISVKPAFLSVGEQDDIGDSDLAVASKDSLLDCGKFPGVKVVEQISNSTSSLAMVEARRWRHDDLAVSIDLKAFGPIGEGGIGADFEPAFGGGSVDRDSHGRKIHQKMAKGIDSRTRVKRLRWFALGCLAGVAGVWAVCASGLRVNGTDSEPIGIYWAISKPPAKGDFVFALPPSAPIFKLAKERGYLAAGPSPAGTCALIKQVAALGGDRVTISAEGVRVNGILLKNSVPRPVDDAGRPMQPYHLGDYTLGSEEVLLMSDYSPASFDGRYFGPLPKTTIQSVIVPILTWR